MIPKIMSTNNASEGQRCDKYDQLAQLQGISRLIELNSLSNDSSWENWNFLVISKYVEITI